jgi:hypothetical protein
VRSSSCRSSNTSGNEQIDITWTKLSWISKSSRVCLFDHGFAQMSHRGVFGGSPNTGRRYRVGQSDKHACGRASSPVRLGIHFRCKEALGRFVILPPSTLKPCTSTKRHQRSWFEAWPHVSIFSDVQQQVQPMPFFGTIYRRSSCLRMHASLSLYSSRRGAKCFALDTRWAELSLHDCTIANRGLGSCPERLLYPRQTTGGAHASACACALELVKQHMWGAACSVFDTRWAEQ